MFTLELHPRGCLQLTTKFQKEKKTNQFSMKRSSSYLKIFFMSLKMICTIHSHSANLLCVLEQMNPDCIQSVWGARRASLLHKATNQIKAERVTTIEWSLFWAQQHGFLLFCSEGQQLPVWLTSLVRVGVILTTVNSYSVVNSCWFM